MNRNRDNDPWWTIALFWVIVAGLIWLGVGGCASHNVTPPTVPWWNPFKGSSNNLNDTNAQLSWIVSLSIVIVGLGAAFATYIKTPLGSALMIGGGVALGLALFLKAALPFLPFLIGVVIVVGGALAWHKYKKTGSWKAAFFG